MTNRVFVEDGNSQTAAPPTALTDVPVRPKIMRRPATFAAPAALAEPSLLTPTSENHAAPSRAAQSARHATRLWHEDARFGLALIVALLMLNTLLGVLVPYLPIAAMKDEKPSGAVLFGSAAMPHAVRQEDPEVTSYLDPQSNQRLSRQFDLNQIDPEKNSLSISPQDVPPPRARALDKRPQ